MRTINTELICCNGKQRYTILNLTMICGWLRCVRGLYAVLRLTRKPPTHSHPLKASASRLPVNYLLQFTNGRTPKADLLPQALPW